MTIKRINSKIKKYFSYELLEKIRTVYKSVLYYEVSIQEFNRFPISLGVNEERILEFRPDGKVRIKLMSNNTRMNLIKNFIRMEWTDKVINFGTGTNRLAVMTESLVFKIAIDKAGCVDNLHEFYMSSELYPYVTKSYETNELILVSEYVNVIKTKDEFDNRKSEIISILRELEDITSLMLDVGFITKNRTNWGIRVSDNKPVILDFAYIYTKLPGIQLACVSKSCREKHGLQMLKYTDNYSAMQCPACKRVYGPASFQRMISTELRKKMYQGKLDAAYKVNRPVTYLEIDEYGGYKEVEADDSMISYDIDKSRAKDIESDYIDVCKEYERQLEFNGIVAQETTDLKEKLRRSLLEVRYDKEYKDIPESEKNYDPYNDLKEPIDLVALTGVGQELEKARQIKEAEKLELQAKIKQRQEELKNLNKNMKEGCVSMNMNKLYNSGKERELTGKELDRTLDELVKITGADLPDQTVEGQILSYAANRDYDEEDDFEKRLTHISNELSGEYDDIDPTMDDEYNIDFISAIMNKKPLPSKTCHGTVTEALNRCIEYNPEVRDDSRNEYWDYGNKQPRKVDPEIKFSAQPVKDERIDRQARNMMDKYSKLLESDDSQTTMEKLAESFTEDNSEEMAALREEYENESIDMVAQIFAKKVKKMQQEPHYRGDYNKKQQEPAKVVPVKQCEEVSDNNIAKELANKVTEKESMERFINELSVPQMMMLKEILDKKLGYENQIKPIEHKIVNRGNQAEPVKVVLETELPKKIEKVEKPVDSAIKTVQEKVEIKIPPVEPQNTPVTPVQMVEDFHEYKEEKQVDVDSKLLEGFSQHKVFPVDPNKKIVIDKYEDEFPIELAFEKNTKFGITIGFQELELTTTYDDVACQTYPTRLEDGTVVKGFTLESVKGKIVIRLHRDTETMYYHEGLKAYFPRGLQESDIPNTFEKYSKVAIRCCECYAISKVRHNEKPGVEVANLVDEPTDDDFVIDPNKMQEAMTQLKGEKYSDSVSALVNGDVDKFIEENLDDYGDFEEADTTFQKITNKNKNWK